MAYSDLMAMGDRAVRDVLGDAVTYSPGVGDPEEVQGIFDALYVRVDVGQPGVSSSGPSVFFLLADLPSDPGSDTAAKVTVGDVEYLAWEVEKDGKGGVRMLLHKVAE